MFGPALSLHYISLSTEYNRIYKRECGGISQVSYFFTSPRLISLLIPLNCDVLHYVG